jgi:hypothetical protein
VLGEEDERDEVSLDIECVHRQLRSYCAKTMHDAAKSVQLVVIKKIVEVIGSENIRWKVIGSLNVSEEIVVDVLSLFICCIRRSNDIRQVFDSLESSRN